MDVIALFKMFLKRKSETPDDGGILGLIEEYLPEFHAIRLDCHNVKNLFLYKKFSSGPHLCFAGHVDVVPAGDNWKFPPYEAIENNNYIYGRGAQDMKSGVSAFVQAVKETKKYTGTLSLLLTSDEEGDAQYGTQEVLKYLKVHNLLPDSCIVAEPTCESILGDTIKVGRRGSINGLIVLHGKQGHAAYPQKAINPIHQISEILYNIAGVDLDNGDEYFAPSKLVVTDIRSGMEVTNVTPDSLRLMFNIRNSTKTTQKSVKAFITKEFQNLNYSLSLTQGAYPFITGTDSKIVKDLHHAIYSITNMEPKYSTAGGTSDARFIAKYGINVIEFGVKNDTIHGVDERTTADEVIKLYKIFKKLINIY